MSQDILLAIFVGILGGALTTVLVLRLSKKTASGAEPLLRELDSFKKHFNERLEAHNMASTQLFGSIKEQLGGLKESSQHLMEIGKDIASLQDILRAPKFRGGLGEFLLADLLAQIIPKEHFSLQYRFASGEQVDALLRLKEFSIPIDAKFPLENFKKTLALTDENLKKKARREFVRDVKKHIDVIREKYIQPDQGTSDYALMYIPAENVYYEVILKADNNDLFEYALSKKVVPVSPNSFYAYLQAIVIGLKGMKIEKSAKAVLERISAVRNKLDAFAESYRLVGVHLQRAGISYSESERKLDRLQHGLTQLEPTTGKPRIEKSAKS